MAHALPTPLARHVEETAGHFSPFTYSIGLTASLEATLSDALTYPLDQPVGPEMLEALARTLTFEHEATHFAQYVSSAYGLRTLRRTNIALRYLNELRPLRLPVLQDLRDRMPDAPERARAAARMYAFLDAADQLRLHRYDVPTSRVASNPSDDNREAVEVSMEPYTPLFLTVTLDVAARREAAHQLAASGIHIYGLPCLYFEARERTQCVIINAAALMESYAVMGECVTLTNAYDEASPVIERYYAALKASEAKGYYAVFQWAYEHLREASGEARLDAFLYYRMFAILVDIALMYDPYVLFDAPFLDRPADDQVRDEMPGEVFVRALVAARDVDPITSGDEDDGTRYYEQVCREMGIPSPAWMADRALDVATTLLERIETAPQRPLLAEAFQMHCAALEIRSRSPTTLTVELLRGPAIAEVLTPCLPHITFYDLVARRAQRFADAELDLVSIHGMVWQALLDDAIECPLAIGEPFHCVPETGGACPWRAEACLAPLIRSWCDDGA